MIKLSICIATYNRGQYISRSLDSILHQMSPDVEIIVVDGASPDNTAEVMAQYESTHSEVHYYREKVNSGVDTDFDKAVGYAKGDYCWLMTDDDLLCEGAIKKVLSAIKGARDLIVVNAMVKNADLTEILEEQRLTISSDKEYDQGEQERFFSDTASYMSFIGCVVIKRSLWLSRDRVSYYGSLFIHIGVIFQSPLVSSLVIAEPLIEIRYGNAMWTQRGFEIWMFKWPNLVWSFSGFSDNAKQKVCRRQPWRSARTLFLHRAMGSYRIVDIKMFDYSIFQLIERTIAYSIGAFPAKLANFIMVLYFILRPKNSWRHMYDLLHSSKSMAFTRFLARIMDVKESKK